MAKLNPDVRAKRPMGAGEYAEHAVLEQLCNGLPDGFDVFHSVDCSTVDGAGQHFGEIDVVVVDSQGHLVLLEVKAGHLEQGAQGLPLAKRYGGFYKDVVAQSNGQLRAMRQRLHDEGFAGFKVAHLLVLPDHRLVSTPIGFPRERIVDAHEAPELCQRMLQLINQGQTDGANQEPDRARLLQFLANRFAICPDPTARIGLLTNAVVRLSDGLATWVPRIHSDAGLYAIEATAGSGKTQLALRLLRDACAQGLRCLYVCFNRPLADHIVHVAPPAAQVVTFHELTIEHWRKQNGDVDFSDTGIYARATQQWLTDKLEDAPPAHLDLLVIDEMQDMEAPWVEALAHQLKATGRMYTLGDSQQSIYGRPGFELAGAVQVRCLDNVRSPRQIVDTINLLRLTDERIVARCPEVGEPPEIRTYGTSDTGGVKALESVVTGLLAKGVEPSSIVIVTFAGKENSQVLARDSIGGLALCKFTGRFDAASNPVWTQGRLLAETLYRFKGQAAPYVILCEIDFTVLDEKQRRKLFVGMTRAQLHLTLVISKVAEMAITEALNASDNV